MTRFGLSGCGALLVAFAPAAFAQKDACSLVSQQQMGSIIGAAVTAAKLHESSVSQSCTYLTSAGGAMGIITISVYKVALPTPEAGLVVQDGDQLTPVSGIGDEATMDANTNELKFRVGAKWVVVSTRGAPCPGDDIGAGADARKACAVKRNVMLTDLAKLAAVVR